MIQKSDFWNETTPIFLDLSYISSVSGALKIVQILLSILCLICTATFPYYIAAYSAMGWMQFASLSSLITTAALLVMRIFHIQDKLALIPWNLLELLYCGIWILFHLSAAAGLLSIGLFLPALICATLFALLLVVAYMVDLSIRLWKCCRRPVQSPPIPSPRSINVATIATQQFRV